MANEVENQRKDRDHRIADLAKRSGVDPESLRVNGDALLKLYEAIQGQLYYLKRARSVFPYMGDSPVGQRRFRTPPFYRNYGFDVMVEFPDPLTEDDVAEIREIGHWINQNFIVRLCALLETEGIIPRKGEGRIDFDLAGSNEVDLVRRLRNKIAHSTGRYDPDDPEARKLRDRLIDYSGVAPRLPTEYPLPIDSVLVPIAEDCSRYVVNFLARRSTTPAVHE